MTKKAFKFIDLFAGTGGLRIPFGPPFGKHNGTCVFSSEIDPFAAKTYEDNFGEVPSGDITKIGAGEIKSHNLLLAGFPCQPFSRAGLRRGFRDTRGTLFFHIARILKHHEPELVLLENVKGFRTHEHGRTFKIVMSALDNLGYQTYAEVLNAKDFGVPQNRERLFMVCLNRKKVKDLVFKFPVPLKIPTRIGDILETNVDPKYTISKLLWSSHKRRRREHAERGNGFGYRLYNQDDPCTSTLPARYYKDGAEVLISQGRRNPRKLTPREAASLQGFPPEFKITVSDTQAYKQFGNAVAVPVVAAIAEKMLKHL